MDRGVHKVLGEKMEHQAPQGSRAPQDWLDHQVHKDHKAAEESQDLEVRMALLAPPVREVKLGLRVLQVRMY